MIKRAIGIVVLLGGCGGPKSQPTDSSPEVTTHEVKSPFEYRIVEQDNKPHFAGAQSVLMVETTNEAAKQATEDDLRQFWQHISPSLGDVRVLIRLRTPIPGALPWGIIKRINQNGKWELSISKNNFGVDAEPYFFVDKIDRSKKNQETMILTLPITNQIVERLKRDGWAVKNRDEDSVSLKQLGDGLESFDVTLTPDVIDLSASQKDDTAIFHAMELLTKELGIAQEIRHKMQSVIGSPEYFRGTQNGVGVWNWRIREYEVSYNHLQTGIDTLTIERQVRE
jgi:hypothetical protein